MADIKWSAFTDGGAIVSGDEVVGLRAGANTRLTANEFDTTILATGTITSSVEGFVSGNASPGGIGGYFKAFSTTANMGSNTFQAIDNSGDYANVLQNAATTDARTWTLPDASGTLALTSGASGIVNSGTADQVAYYASTGTTLSGTSTLPTTVQTNITRLGTIAQNITCTNNGTGNRWLLLNSDAGGTFSMQAGIGTAAGGGAFQCYGHTNATRPGWAAAAISSGSGGKFAVLSGGPGGTEQFTVDQTGNVVANGSLTAGASSDVSASSNAALKFTVDNSSTGTAAEAQLRLDNDVSGGGLRLPGSGYTNVPSYANRLQLSTDSSVANGILIRTTSTGGIQLTADGSINNPNLLVDVSGNTSLDGSLSVTGDVTSSAGFIGSAGSINQQVAAATNGTTYSIAKTVSGTSATTFLQLTIPASNLFVIVECFLTVSRGAGSDKGTSMIKKSWFSIARNGSGTDVVLDGNILLTSEATTTTAGGSQSVAGATGAMTVVRDGAEANTLPQVVNLTVNPVLSAGNTGRAVVLNTIILQGDSTGFIIA